MVHIPFSRFDPLGIPKEHIPPSRLAIIQAHRQAEPECLQQLVKDIRLPHHHVIAQRANEWIRGLRADPNLNHGVEGLMHEFSLSSEEGLALMCLAEALLRIPDDRTRDALIEDKIVKGQWREHSHHTHPLLVNVASWSLWLAGQVLEVPHRNLFGKLFRQGGQSLIRQAMMSAMAHMGSQFVMGETIEKALEKGQTQAYQSFCFSYDMLGEAALTEQDAQAYAAAYERAIRTVGRSTHRQKDSISIKLSALHPRYQRWHKTEVMTDLYQSLLRLVCLAKDHQIPISIDAEECDRLMLSLDLFEALCFDEQLDGYTGLGFVVQAYQKRAPFVLDLLIDMAKHSNRRLMVRLVKGAYWDTEIKRAQVEGLADYPVFTRKTHTDVSYLVCAQKLLDAHEWIYPQFASHNAHTVSAVYTMALERNLDEKQYEFQCLYGMGERLCAQVMQSTPCQCRMYAPVGHHKTLLAYLVRRLLENGANSSFVHQVVDESQSIEELVENPIDKVLKHAPMGLPHPSIPLPEELYGKQRRNTKGMDLYDEGQLAHWKQVFQTYATQSWVAGMPHWHDQSEQIINPARQDDTVGLAYTATSEAIAEALQLATDYHAAWQGLGMSHRAAILVTVADRIEDQFDLWLAMLVREAGKHLISAVAEVREAVDFLRYYSHQARTELPEQVQGLGVVVCISPWNFPMAIFLGQVSAALVTGNAVLAKPAEQTPLIAQALVDVLHQAGIPKEVLHCLPGDGLQVGAPLVADHRVSGVIFTGSTEVAQNIDQVVRQRLSPHDTPVVLIAETGGQNAMIIDSSALPEQVIQDVMQSSFDAAGQRCSALRILCLQEDIADDMLIMLKGAIQSWSLGPTDCMEHDIGPVIDAEAQRHIERHIDTMRTRGFKVTQYHTPPEGGSFVPPTLIEIPHVGILEREVFGPVLHVVRYAARDIDHLINSINRTGYALTFGVHSRIDHFVDHVCQNIQAGNLYVNRNMVGAVVGVQPFGGHGLSGTGPKAGGPLYLYRLIRATTSSQKIAEQHLPGPTGEENLYRQKAKGHVLCCAKTHEGAQAQWDVINKTGNQAIFLFSEELSSWLDQHPDITRVKTIPNKGLFDVALFEGTPDDLRAFLASMPSIVPVITAPYTREMLYLEEVISTNTAASGGNARLIRLEDYV